MNRRGRDFLPDAMPPTPTQKSLPWKIVDHAPVLEVTYDSGATTTRGTHCPLDAEKFL